MDREIDIVVKSEENMKLLLHFFVLELRTLDGLKNTAMAHMRLMGLNTLKGQIRTRFTTV